MRAAGHRPRPEAQRVRAGRRRPARRVQRRGRPLQGARPGLHPAGAARGHRRDRGRRATRRCRTWSRPTTSSGVFHCHTTDSDGGDTLEEMAAGGQGAGPEVPRHRRPLAIADRGQRPEPRARPPAAGGDRRAQQEAQGHPALQGHRVRHPGRRPPRLSTTTCWRRSITSWPASTAISTSRARR